MSRGKGEERIVVGLHSCEEALKVNSRWVQEVSIAEGKDRDYQHIHSLCQKQKLNFKIRSKKYFNNLAEGHQGIAVVLSDRPRWNDQSAERDNSLVVFLDGITDPHNMGAILRSAWLLEVDGVFIPKNRRVDLTPAVCKVASGGAEHVPVESCHFGSQLQWFKDQGYWVHGLRENGDILLPQQKPGGKTVLIVGAEGKGMRSSTENFCDQFVSIPQVASGSSFNASVAFSICAYEYTRHRHI